jgi:hypothetical protein
MFRLFISENAIENTEIYGANSFRLLTACKLKAIPEEVSNFSFIDYPIIEAGNSFPYIDSSAIMAKLYVNGLTKKGLILINSASKCGWIIKPKTIESNQHWYHYYFKILKEELNSSIKLSFCIPETYQNEELIIIYRLFNQFDHEIPVYSNPIGGVQIFEYNFTPISK